jgi:hypothetical protein
MKAIVQEGYGSPDTLKLREVEPPATGDDGVLVEVHAASVNALDWHLVRGVPVFIRVLEAIGGPKQRIRGVDLAGRVTAVGKKVTRFKPGDEVLGGADGSFAEFTVTTEKRLAPKPAGITFEQAATLNIAGLTDFLGCATARGAPRAARAGQRCRRGRRNLRRADREWLGSHVTAVTRAASADLVRSPGADEVIDHGVEDFTRRPDRWDVIFDIGGNRPFSRCRRTRCPAARCSRWTGGGRGAGRRPGAAGAEHHAAQHAEHGRVGPDAERRVRTTAMAKPGDLARERRARRMGTPEVDRSLRHAGAAAPANLLPETELSFIHRTGKGEIDRGPPSPHDEGGQEEQDARRRDRNVQDDNVGGNRAEHDGGEQRGSGSRRLRHQDQHGSGELEETRDVPEPPSDSDHGEELDQLRLPQQLRHGSVEEDERQERLDAPEQNVEHYFSACAWATN